MSNIFKSFFSITNRIVNKKNINAILVLLYFFQYGLMIPFAILLKSQYPIIIFTLILVGLSLLFNEIRFTNKTILLFTIPLILLILKLPFEYKTTEEGNVALELIISFLTIGFSGILIGSLNFSFQHIIKYGIVISWINFLVLFLVPFTPLYNEEVNYMRFGYTLLPTVLFSFSNLLSKKKKSTLILFILSFLDMLVFGSRGSLLTFVLFLIFYIYFTSIVNKKTKIYLTFILFLLSINLKNILNFIVEYANNYTLYSYAIVKYLNLFDGSSLASTSSGRDEIYETAINRIFNSPILGSPLNSSYVDTGSTYYHNIFLDIIVNFGILGFIFFVCFILYTFYKATRIKNYYFISTFLIIFFVTMGRLVVSSSFWQRPEFWILMAISVNLKKKNINF